MMFSMTDPVKTPEIVPAQFKVLLSLLLTVGCLLGAYLLLKSYFPKPDSGIPSHTRWARQYWPKRMAVFRKHPLQGEEVVFLGDSLTEKAYEFGIHLRIEPLSRFRNRGIAGDSSEGVLARLEEIIASRPQAVFLLIGINDLLFSPLSLDAIHQNIVTIAEKLVQGNPGTVVWVQTLLPTDQGIVNAKVERLNQMIVASSSSTPYRVLDLYPHFLGADHLIHPTYTWDGLHLSPEGYAKWGELLRPVVKDLDSKGSSQE